MFSDLLQSSNDVIARIRSNERDAEALDVLVNSLEDAQARLFYERSIEPSRTAARDEIWRKLANFNVELIAKKSRLLSDLDAMRATIDAQLTECNAGHMDRTLETNSEHRTFLEASIRRLLSEIELCKNQRDFAFERLIDAKLAELKLARVRATLDSSNTLSELQRIQSESQIPTNAVKSNRMPVR
jgi:hypothetical protein